MKGNYGLLFCIPRTRPCLACKCTAALDDSLCIVKRRILHGMLSAAVLDQVFVAAAALVLGEEVAGEVLAAAESVQAAEAGLLA